MSCDGGNRDYSSFSASDAEAPSVREPQGRHWVVDPEDPGVNLPPTGRSLFDFLVTEPEGNTKTYRVPFPFSALMKTIEKRLGAEHQSSPLKRVLVPLGRSLQRNAAKPEFFKYPRAVVAVDTEPLTQPGSSGMLFKDRLYLGYQEKANLIEVISYNEAAGRFEFQIVRDYRPGGTPQVFYANRAVCTVCHQNQAPIFARPLWDETNANPRIASLLRAEQRTFYGFPIEQGVDIPFAIDAATDRANEFSAYQLLWQEGCEAAASRADAIGCRARIFSSMLQYRLSGSRHVDARSSDSEDQVVPLLAKVWRENWPQGLAIPNPDVPNRNPFLHAGQARAQSSMLTTVRQEGRASWGTLTRQADLGAVFAPSVPRASLETWSVSPGTSRSVVRVITGLSSFLAEADIRRLDGHLFRIGKQTGVPVQRYQSTCEYSTRRRRGGLDRLKFRCHRPDRSVDAGETTLTMTGLIYLKGREVVRGTIDHVKHGDGGVLANLDVVGGRIQLQGHRWVGDLQVLQKYSGLHARRADGKALSNLTLGWADSGKGAAYPSHQSSFSGNAVMTTMDDFALVHNAVSVMAGQTDSGEVDAFSSMPFRRASAMKVLFVQLGMGSLEWCCVDDRGMPPAVLDVGAGDPDPAMHENGKDHHPAVHAFHQYCTKCHNGLDELPPNFLYGDAERVQSNIAHCAERIFFRLEMARISPQVRPETPMPPTNALRRWDLSPTRWSRHADFAVLNDYVRNVLETEIGTAPRLQDLRMRGYDNLRDCLPEFG